jgi:aspartate-semialdehyde dehydrogenase
MPEKSLSIAIAGAGTLLGKMLVDTLARSPLGTADLRLLDAGEDTGLLTSAGDEAALIQPIDAASFAGCEYAFFAGSATITRKYWRVALDAGCRVIDLSGVLERTGGALVRAALIPDEAGAVGPDLQTRAVASAHPIAILLALLGGRLARAAAVHSLWVTLLQPASEYGQPALEELHRQTANLLSFQPMPEEVFGGQSAFSLRAVLGDDPEVSLTATAETVTRHLQLIAPQLALPALQLIQTPVFHGYGVSAGVEFEQAVSLAALLRALEGSLLQVTTDVAGFPGSVQAVEEADAQVLVRAVPQTASTDAAPENTRYWCWVIADNLMLAVQNAVACALELNRLRPRGAVQ